MFTKKDTSLNNVIKGLELKPCKIENVKCPTVYGFDTEYTVVHLYNYSKSLEDFLSFFTYYVDVFDLNNIDVSMFGCVAMRNVFQEQEKENKVKFMFDLESLSYRYNNKKYIKNINKFKLNLNEPFYAEYAIKDVNMLGIPMFNINLYI